MVVGPARIPIPVASNLMKTTLPILALAALILASSLPAEEPKPINPALLYWQAAAVLPPLTPEQAKELRELATNPGPFDQAKARSLPSSESALRFIRKATISPAACDWGLATEDGPATLMPHLGKIREMSSLVLVQAETDFATGHVKEGLEWLITAHRMAQHAGASPFLISNLVQFAMDMDATRAAARHCLGWDESTRQMYAGMLKALPPLHTTLNAYAGEQAFIDWVERRIGADGKPTAEVEEMIKAVTVDNEKPTPEMLAVQFAPGAMKAALAELRSLESRTQILIDKPWKESQGEMKALVEESKRSPHFLVRVSYVEVASISMKQYAVATLRTMLEAALQFGSQLDEGSAATYHDAFEGEPLILKKNADGTLTLAARHSHPAGKDLALTLAK